MVRTAAAKQHISQTLASHNHTGSPRFQAWAAKSPQGILRSVIITARHGHTAQCTNEYDQRLWHQNVKKTATLVARTLPLQHPATNHAPTTTASHPHCTHAVCVHATSSRRLPPLARQAAGVFLLVTCTGHGNKVKALPAAKVRCAIRLTLLVCSLFQFICLTIPTQDRPCSALHNVQTSAQAARYNCGPGSNFTSPAFHHLKTFPCMVWHNKLCRYKTASHQQQNKHSHFRLQHQAPACRSTLLSCSALAGCMHQPPPGACKYIPHHTYTHKFVH